MSDVLLHARTDKLLFSGDRDNQVQWRGSGAEELHTEFKQGELFTRTEENTRGVKKVFSEARFTSAWYVCKVSVSDDSDVWFQLPLEWAQGKERFKPFFDFC